MLALCNPYRVPTSGKKHRLTLSLASIGSLQYRCPQIIPQGRARLGDTMKQELSFVSHLLDLMAPIGTIKARSMFGGYGLFYQNMMFAIVTENTLYLKADDVNRPQFVELGLPAFTYARQGRTFVISYHRVPPTALEDSQELCRWAESARAAALRAAAESARTRKKRPRKNSLPEDNPLIGS